MRIGIAIDKLAKFHGIQRVVFELARMLRRRNKITLITFEDRCSEELIRRFKKIRVEFLFFKYKNFISSRKYSLKEYAKEISKSNLDIINSHGPILGTASSLSNIPTVLTYHGITKPFNFFNYFWWLSMYLNYLPSVYLADKVVAISRYIKKELETYYRRKDCIVIYNGIDTRKFKPSKKLGRKFREKFSIKEDEVLVGYVGREAPHKNHEFLIKLTKKLGVKLVLVGPTSLKGDKDVYIIPKLSEKELVGFYNTIKIYAHPSLWEGFGLPLLEAQACGKPVVAFNKCAMREVVIHGKTGYLANNSREFKFYLKKLLSNVELRAKFGINALRFVQKFKVEDFSSLYEKVFYFYKTLRTKEHK